MKFGETQPKLSNAPVIQHPLEFAGLSVAQKMAKLREKMKTENAGVLVIPALDEIACVFDLFRCELPINTKRNDKERIQKQLFVPLVGALI